ncbi:type II secretion system F family protein [Paenibacillus sp. D51F]
MWTLWIAGLMASAWLTAAWRHAAASGMPLLAVLLRWDKQALAACFGAPALIQAVEEARLMPRIEEHVAGLHASMIILKGEAWTPDHTRQYLALACVHGCGAALAGLLLAAAAGEQAVAWLGFACGVLIPASKVREIRESINKRKQALLLALPDLLVKLMLLVGAGETMQKALARCAAFESGGGLERLLHAELGRAVHAMGNGLSFAAAMEAFSRRCAVQEVSVFTTVLLLNYRRGGEQLALSLREISHPLWEKRKSLARTRGEEASSKLVFPLTGIFFLLMVLVGAPAMLLMN